MANPQIPIDVDTQTGVWSTSELPMLFMPRHFFINNHDAVEQAVGKKTYAAQLYTAGYKSAWEWCDHEAKQTGKTGMAVFHHYMERISQRGWGQFDGSGIDAVTGCGEVVLRNSCFVLQAGEKSGDAHMCYLFAGWFPGSIAWALQKGEASFNLVCEETQCCSSKKHDQCIFTVKPAE